MYFIITRKPWWICMDRFLQFARRNVDKTSCVLRGCCGFLYVLHRILLSTSFYSAYFINTHAQLRNSINLSYTIFSCRWQTESRIFVDDIHPSLSVKARMCRWCSFRDKLLGPLRYIRCSPNLSDNKRLHKLICWDNRWEYADFRGNIVIATYTCTSC